jgi:hypothetical protein
MNCSNSLTEYKTILPIRVTGGPEVGFLLLGLILQNGQLMVNAISVYCIFEQSVATVPSSKCFRTFIPTDCLKAILNIGFGPTSPVKIGVQDHTALVSPYPIPLFSLRTNLTSDVRKPLIPRRSRRAFLDWWTC